VVAERRTKMAEKPKKPIKNLKPITAQVKKIDMSKFNTKGKKK
jgi:hypothetical protein